MTDEQLPPSEDDGQPSVPGDGEQLPVPSEGEQLPAPEDSSFDAMSDEELLREIERLLSVCTASLLALSSAVAAATRRNVDLSRRINPQLLDCLRKIHSRQIDAGMAERYLMDTTTFNLLKRLPLEDQKKIAESGSVELVVRHEGRFDTRMFDVEALTPTQRKLAFAGGRLRTKSEMIARLEDEMEDEAEDDPFEDAEVTLKIVWPLKARKALKKAAAQQGKTEGQVLLDWAKAKGIL